MSWPDDGPSDENHVPAGNTLQQSGHSDDYIRYATLCALWDEFKTEYDLCDPEIVARFRREKDWCL